MILFWFLVGIYIYWYNNNRRIYCHSVLEPMESMEPMLTSLRSVVLKYYVVGLKSKSPCPLSIRCTPHQSTLHPRPINTAWLLSALNVKTKTIHWKWKFNLINNDYIHFKRSEQKVKWIRFRFVSMSMKRRPSLADRMQLLFVSIFCICLSWENMELSRPNFKDKLFLITINALCTAIDWHTIEWMACISHVVMWSVIIFVRQFDCKQN